MSPFPIVHVGIVDARTDIVHGGALGDFRSERDEFLDETFLHNLFCRNLRLVLEHLHHHLRQLVGTTALGQQHQVTGQVLYLI